MTRGMVCASYERSQTLSNQAHFQEATGVYRNHWTFVALPSHLTSHTNAVVAELLHSDLWHPVGLALQDL